jgi:hypothetical protein
MSFTIVADPRQRSHSRVRVPWDSRPYFTVSDSKLPFSSPPTTRMATVEAFDPASTRYLHTGGGSLSCYNVPTNLVEATSFNSTVIAFWALTMP